MAFSLYYEAKRKEPLTEQEKAISKKSRKSIALSIPFNEKLKIFVYMMLLNTKMM